MGSPSNQLEALQEMTVVVADTGDVSQIKEYKPIDCTTNPSLLYKVVDLPAYEPILKQALAAELANPENIDKERPYSGAVDRFATGVGEELLQIVPGSVSTECDARLAYDTEATVAKGRRLINLYKDRGFDKARIYIKIATTWEGIQACKQLEQEGIRTNMTLLFSFAQAVGCADAKAALISPFVGRILDWYKANEGRDFAPEEDPGVLSVRRIYWYYKAHGVSTDVMGASFRNVGEVQQLAGCDKLTVSPALLGELAALEGALPRMLSPEMAAEKCEDEKLPELDEETFRAMLAEDRMATEKLEQGINSFAADQDKLEARIAERAAEWGLEISV